MKTYTTSEMRQRSGSLIDTVLTDGMVALSRHGRPVAYVISAKTAIDRGLVAAETETVAQARPVGDGRPVDENGDPYSATAREIADQVHVSLITINQLVTDLIADPQWGREKVIAVPSNEIGATLIHKDAAILIAKRAIATKSHRPHQDGAA